MKNKFKELGDIIADVCKKRFELECFINEYSLFRGGYDNVFFNCNNLLVLMRNDSEVLSGLSDDEVDCLYNFTNIIINFADLGDEAIDKLNEFNIFNNDPIQSLNEITNLLIKYYF